MPGAKFLREEILALNRIFLRARRAVLRAMGAAWQVKM